MMNWRKLLHIQIKEIYMNILAFVEEHCQAIVNQTHPIALTIRKNIVISAYRQIYPVK
jgi:hypothetical protein